VAPAAIVIFWKTAMTFERLGFVVESTVLTDNRKTGSAEAEEVPAFEVAVFSAMENTDAERQSRWPAGEQAASL